MSYTDVTSNVFFVHITPAKDVAPADLEALMTAESQAFAIASRPYLDSGLFTHRILRASDQDYIWEITFEGCDLPAEDQAAEESLVDAISGEVRARIATTGEVTSATAYADMMPPRPSVDIVQRAPTADGPMAFGAEDELPAWESYAQGSGAAEAGGELHCDVLEAIKQSRAAIPVEPGLKKWGKGHIYAGSGDKAHVAYLQDYFNQRAERASPSDRRKIQAFRAFQSREGSTAAINTYDNQIVTWGTGWGGFGLLGKVMQRAVANPAVRALFQRCGVRYRGRNIYDVVDVDAKRVRTGTREPLEAMRQQVPLLYMLIHASRSPETRDAVSEAQLLTFFEGAGNVPGSDGVATQALFNLVAHLKHWAPGYITPPGKRLSCLDWALPQVGDSPVSADRDHRLAVLVGRYFYAMPHNLKMRWTPDWKQFQLYWRHMRDDGLDCLSDPFIQASGPPADDPFASIPVSPTQAPAGDPKKPVPAGERVLKNAPITGQAELEQIAGGRGLLRRGSRGAGVKALQEALMGLKYDVPGGADGIFGKGLESAVKAFQKNKGLASDGLVGAGTLKALDAALA